MNVTLEDPKMLRTDEKKSELLPSYERYDDDD